MTLTSIVMVRMPRNKHSSLWNNFQRTFTLKWIQHYDKELTYVWSKIPWPLNKVAVSVAVFAFGISFSGYWAILWVHVSRHFGFSSKKLSSSENYHWSLESVRLQNFWSYFLGSTLVSYVLFFSIGGFLQWYYYIRRRNKPENWKCQPTRFLSTELERSEFILGSSTLFVQCILTSILACYISNGGYSTVYDGFKDYGLLWLFLQIPVVFIYQDYLVYWVHRIFHSPWLYKHFHKLHHRYKQPTVWSVTAIHPLEALFIQSVLMSPIFLFPVHWLLFYSILIYLFYHGMRDHSGINFKSFWWQPWQPDTIFHDNHHQYFHVNFGFNIKYWDQLHGTSRQQNRVYNENIYYGRGKSLKEATKLERRQHSREIKAENPICYRKN